HRPGACRPVRPGHGGPLDARRQDERPALEQDRQEPRKRFPAEVQGRGGRRGGLASDRDDPRRLLRDLRCVMAKRKLKVAVETADGSRTDWDNFLDGLPGIVDGGKLAKARAMLRAERFQLFAEVHPGYVTGVVRSQSSASRVYACRLASDGRYSCCTQ